MFLNLPNPPNLHNQYVIEFGGGTSMTAGEYRQSVLDGYEDDFHFAMDADWDGDNSPPLTPEVINLARRLVDQYASELFLVEVSPGKDGSLSFVWDDKRGNYVYLDVGQGERIHLYYDVVDKPKWEAVSHAWDTEVLRQLSMSLAFTRHPIVVDIWPSATDQIALSIKIDTRPKWRFPRQAVQNHCMQADGADHWLRHVLEGGATNKSGTAVTIGFLARKLTRVIGKPWEAEISGRLLNIAKDIAGKAEAEVAKIQERKPNQGIKFRSVIYINIGSIRAADPNVDVFACPTREDNAHANLVLYSAPLEQDRERQSGPSISHECLRRLQSQLKICPATDLRPIESLRC